MDLPDSNKSKTIIVLEQIKLSKLSLTYTKYHGELQDGKRVDQVLREYFPNYSYKGVFIDVGAYKPIEISNSYHFERNEWKVYCLEANPNLISDLMEHRNNVYNFAVYDEDKDGVEFNIVYGPKDVAGCSAIELDPRYMSDNGGLVNKIEKVMVKQITLDTFIIEQNIKNIDILQIDVEGGELKVLQGLSLINPKVILVEDIYDSHELYQFLIDKGYRLDKTISYNKYFILGIQSS